MKRVITYVLMVAFVHQSLYATPGVPSLPAGIPDPSSGADISTIEVLDSDSLESYSGADLIPSEDIETIRGLISEGSQAGSDLLDRAEQLTGQAGTVATQTLGQIEKVFTPEKLLLGGVAAYTGLSLGAVVLDRVTSGLSTGVEFILKKLTEDVEKINYEIFYKELSKLEKSISDMDKISELVKKSQKLLDLKEKMSPLIGEMVSDEDKEAFISKVTCDSSIDLFSQAKMRKNLRGIIHKIQSDESFDAKLCLYLSRLEEVQSRIDEVSRELMIKFEDMKEYRLRKTRESAEAAFEAWEDKVENNNPYLDKIRSEAISCLSDSEKIKNTSLEKIASRFGKNGKFNFVATWNKLFSNHDIAAQNGFDRNMDQKEYLGKLRKIVQKISCNGGMSLNECIRSLSDFKIELDSDSDALNTILRIKAKQANGEKLTMAEDSLIWNLEARLDVEERQFISSPFGNVILSSGPSSVSSHYTRAHHSIGGNIQRTRPVRGVFKGDLIKINDLNQLSCGHDFVKNKALCKEMLRGMREVMSGGCKDQFYSGNLISKANERLEKEREKREKGINVAVIKEKLRVKRLGNFVDLLNSPSDESIEQQLRKLADEYDSYVDRGICQKRY